MVLGKRTGRPPCAGYGTQNITKFRLKIFWFMNIKGSATLDGKYLDRSPTSSTNACLPQEGPRRQYFGALLQTYMENKI